MARHVKARFGLATALRGRGKAGRILFEADLGIPRTGGKRTGAKPGGRHMTTRARDVAWDWWNGLRDGTGGHRAALSRMRRAHTPLDIVQEPAALRLIARLRPFGRDDDRAAILAGVLALVREDQRTRVARAMGRRSLDDEQSARLSESRFRRLMQADGDELLPQMRRLVQMAGGTVNVRDLADGILHWGDRVRMDWTFEYYGVGSATPHAADTRERR